MSLCVLHLILYISFLLQDLPVPFPIPSFRSQTETKLASKLLTEVDRKYMVQTLTTVLMTYISRPSLKDCQDVAKALLLKFPFISSEDDGDTLVMYD